MRVFITGATGFIGSELLKRLSPNTDVVYALTRQKKYSKVANKTVKYIIGDLQEINKFVKEIESVDCFIHCGAELDSKNSNLNIINIESSKNIINILKSRSDIKFIFLSSATVLKNRHKTEYSNSKLEIDEYIIKNLSNYLIIRPTWVIGNKSKSFINFLNHLEKFPFVPLIGNGETKISPVYIDDLIVFIIDLISKDSRGIYYASSQKSVSYKNYIIYILGQLNLNKSIISLPIWICVVLSKYTNLLSNDALSDFLEEINFPENSLSIFNETPLDYKKSLEKILTTRKNEKN